MSVVCLLWAAASAKRFLDEEWTKAEVKQARLERRAPHSTGKGGACNPHGGSLPSERAHDEEGACSDLVAPFSSVTALLGGEFFFREGALAAPHFVAPLSLLCWGLSVWDRLVEWALVIGFFVERPRLELVCGLSFVG
jgi:hypothetical protein